MSHRFECDIVRPICAIIAGWMRYFIFAHCRAAIERFSSMCCARSIALMSQGDFCDPARYAGIGNCCRHARRFAFGVDRPKYFSQTRSRGISDSPNSARSPKYVGFILRPFSRIHVSSTQINCGNLFSLMAELLADDEAGPMVLVSLLRMK